MATPDTMTDGAGQADDSLREPIDGLGGLRKETLAQQAYKRLELALMCGQLRPGHPVSLRSLARVLQVSLMPVRDAINQLITRGALELLPNRSIRVPLMTQAKFDELTDVRCMLEYRLALAGAARLDDGDFDELCASNERMAEHAKEGEVEAFLQANYDFHFLIYRAARSEVALSITESLWLQAGPFLNEYIRSAGFIVAAAHHERFIDAARRGDHKTAANEVVLDIKDAAKAARAVLA